MKKIFLTLLLALMTTSSWACLLIKGEVLIDKDKLKLHHKFDVDQTYPFRTNNYLVHLKVLSQKESNKNIMMLTIRHPKTFTNLGELIIKLEENKEVKSSMTTPDRVIETQFTLKRI